MSNLIEKVRNFETSINFNIPVDEFSSLELRKLMSHVYQFAKQPAAKPSNGYYYLGKEIAAGKTALRWYRDNEPVPFHSESIPFLDIYQEYYASLIKGSEYMFNHNHNVLKMYGMEIVLKEELDKMRATEVKENTPSKSKEDLLIEQAEEKYGDIIMYNPLFDRGNIPGVILRYVRADVESNEGYSYEEDTDSLYVLGNLIYKAGVWADIVPDDYVDHFYYRSEEIFKLGMSLDMKQEILQSIDIEEIMVEEMNKALEKVYIRIHERTSDTSEKNQAAGERGVLCDKTCSDKQERDSRCDCDTAQLWGGLL